jgi:hypothetical protein
MREKEGERKKERGKMRGGEKECVCVCVSVVERHISAPHLYECKSKEV